MKCPPNLISPSLLSCDFSRLADETAMIERLSDGRLGGAYLDVFEEEPLPPTSPLWSVPTVIVSPHDSESVENVHHRLDGYFLRNLQYWLRAEPLENEVSER